MSEVKTQIVDDRFIAKIRLHSQFKWKYGKGKHITFNKTASTCCKSSIFYERNKTHLCFYCVKCQRFLDYLPNYYR